MAEIILVDDHEIFRNGLKAVLNQIEGIQVITDLEDGADFIDVLPSFKPDLVLMDINMPKLNGIEASKKALEIFPDLKILVLSMYDDSEFYNQLINIGVKGFILKDTNYKELEMAINKVLAGETYFSQALLLKLLESKKKSVKIDLTNREQEVLQLLAHGYTTSEISEKLFISLRTVERHRANLFIKTNTNNSLKLLVFAIRNNLVEIE